MQIENQKGDLYALMAKVKEQHDKQGDFVTSTAQLQKATDAEGNPQIIIEQNGGEVVFEEYYPLDQIDFSSTVNRIISNKVDVWSIGVIYYQMLLGKRPFGDGMSQDRVLSNSLILNAKSVQFPDKPAISSGAKEFISWCLTHDMNSRPDIASLCAAPYLRQKKL